MRRGSRPHSERRCRRASTAAHTTEHARPPDGGHSELEQLQAALAAAQAQVRAMEAKVSMWEECIAHWCCVMLSPR